LMNDKCLSWQKQIIRILAIVSLLLPAAACSAQRHFSVEILQNYNALFQRQDGWTGADGAYTVKLSGDRILWLFGDTWYGEIREGRHTNATIVNNSIAIQHGIIPVDASVRFYAGRAPGGEPLAFIRPSEGHGWFWFYHGIEVDKALYLCLIQADRSDNRNSFGFKIIGNRLGRVANPEDLPPSWRISQNQIPWEGLSPNGDTIFGSAFLKANKIIYIFGTNEDVVGSIRQKYMILARAPESQLEQFDQWQFFSAGRWSNNFNEISRLAGDFANEFSVSYLAELGKYIVVYSAKGLSKNIVARFAPKPWGPWSEPEVLYACPEASLSADVFCYAAKGHPELSSAPDEIIVTYIASSMDFEKIAVDAKLYRPSFLRVKFWK